MIVCDKRAAKRAYEGNRGYQPVLALWAEQDVIVADEFRDGNVPAQRHEPRARARVTLANVQLRPFWSLSPQSINVSEEERADIVVWRSHR